MGVIQQLPADIIAQIAAGEVIERPAFAVKELVENSLDAGATIIRIDIAGGGLTGITVSDNGRGMDAADVELAVQSHTTSKLTNRGLDAIVSFGFRGEALASIASVSRLTVRSRRPDDTTGTEIVVESGRVVSLNRVGMPAGTVVSVEGLFASVPARRRFLKSPAAEIRRIVEVVTAIAIAHPLIRIFLTHDQRTILDLSPAPLPERMAVVFGSGFGQEFIPVTHTSPYVTVSGFIAKPQFAAKSATRHHLYINNRWVRHRATAVAVREAYGTLLPSQSYPVFTLFLTVPPETVDVNIHPRKEEIALTDPGLITEAVETAVVQSLAASNVTYHDTRWRRSDEELYDRMGIAGSVRDGLTDSYAAAVLKKVVAPAAVPVRGSEFLQLHRTYIVVERSDGIVLIDQHAAHERVLYEQLMTSFQSHSRDGSTDLADPVILNLSSADRMLLEDHMTAIQALGFGIEPFGRDSYAVVSAPAMIHDRDQASIIREMLDDLRDAGRIRNIDSRTQRMVAYLACRSAIKAGDTLTIDQMKQLVVDLEGTPNHETCPHGRPTTVLMPLGDINRLFKRP